MAPRVQMVSGLNEPRERCGICRDDRIGTREAAEIMIAELTGARPGRDAGEWVLAVKAEHRNRVAARDGSIRRRFDAARRDTSLDVSEEGALQGCDAHLVLTFHLRALHVAHRGGQVRVVRDLLRLPQIPRQSIKGREHAGTYCGEGKWWQVMTFDELLPRLLDESPTQWTDPHVALRDKQSVAVSGRDVRPQPLRPLQDLAHQCRWLKQVGCPEAAALQFTGTAF